MIGKRIKAGLLVAAWAVCVGAATAQEGGPGLEIGKPFPDLTVTDQDGRTQSVSAFRGKGVSAIVFHRSADW